MHNGDAQTPTARAIIAVISIGDRPWVSSTFAIIQSYARRIGADSILIRDLPANAEFPLPKLLDKPGRPNKVIYAAKAYWPGVLLQSYDKVALLDDTCIVTNNTPDIFERMGVGDYAGVVEPAIDIRNTWSHARASFQTLRKAVANNEIPELQYIPENYFNNGLLVYNQNARSALTVSRIMEGVNLLYGDFPHQTLTYYLVNQLKPKHLNSEFNCMRIFDCPRIRADIDLSPLMHAYIYHVTSWWRAQRTRVIETVIDRLSHAGRIDSHVSLLAPPS